MSLAQDPSLLFGTSGNVQAITVLNNYPTSPSSCLFTVDASNSLAAVLQITGQGGGSVNSTNGILYQVFSTIDNTWYDTNPYYPPYQIPMIASTTSRQSFLLSTGKYKVQLTNMDPSNAIVVCAGTGNMV